MTKYWYPPLFSPKFFFTKMTQNGGEEDSGWTLFGELLIPWKGGWNVGKSVLSLVGRLSSRL